jgi:hypothetical protein
MPISPSSDGTLVRRPHNDKASSPVDKRWRLAHVNHYNTSLRSKKGY